MGRANQRQNSGSFGGGLDLHVFGGIGQFSLINPNSEIEKGSLCGKGCGHRD
jgi:hypothetical protein